MKSVYGLSAALLLGTTMLAGAAIARDKDDAPPPHAHFSAPSSSHESGRIVPTRGDPGSWAWSHGYKGGNNSRPPANANANANAAAAARANNSNANWAWSRNHNGGQAGAASHPHWNANNLHDHNVAHFNAQDRSTWQHGHWQHGKHHGRNGWWWNSGGAWFFYDQPVYPYPGYVSDTYYDDDYYADDGYGAGYADPGYGAEPGDGGYYWYYCNNPAGYYPYVKSCRGPWRAVTPTPDAQQQGYDQGPDDDSDQGPPPGYSDDDRGPPPGYNNEPAPRDQYNGPNDDDQGPPPGYNDDRGPPPGDNNAPDDDNGPPPPPR